MAEERPLEEQVRFRVENRVAWITIDRPEVGNALSPPCRDRIRDLVNGLNTSYEARAIVLTATGEKMFCPGADLMYRREELERPEGVPDRAVGDAYRMMRDGQYTLFPAILDSDLPIIAAVNGTAAGMGSHLALACDLVVAADTAKFVEVFMRRGLIPDALGAYLLPRLVGPRLAKELVFFAEDIPADRALELGLVNRVVPAAGLAEAAREWAERLATGPTKAIGLAKWLINQSLDVDRQTMINNESWAVEVNTHTEDSREGVASFRERRQPEWKGY
ncbi:MAG: Short-chain-enoyl-CoA hydratase [Acidimicrobiales bacterium]|nr:MAG: enoyl-CoA hydratase/isomerase family protein [Actinomycetota bacterium]MBV6508162.1 Short-chain-enoyl-CoA hydratase [Acidimicrobiales bacterium]RIK08183.1 MAG: enoyl-CoA hydratase [Acidobacteriota bacterium]